jgi:hypothetical protein
MECRSFEVAFRYFYASYVDYQLAKNKNTKSLKGTRYRARNNVSLRGNDDNTRARIHLSQPRSQGLFEKALGTRLHLSESTQPRDETTASEKYITVFTRESKGTYDIFSFVNRQECEFSWH